MASGMDGLQWVERHSGFQDANHCRFVDDEFRGHSLDTLNTWRLQSTGGRGYHSILDNFANGVLNLTTGNQANDEIIMDMFLKRQVDPSLSPVLLVRARPTSVTDIKMRLGLVDVLDTDHCIFLIDFTGIGDISIYAEAYNAGGQTESTDTGIDNDGNFHYFGIYIDSTGKPYWYIDGVLEVEGDAADVDPTEFFMPYVGYETEDAQNRPIDVDFIKGWQRRE